MIRQIFVLFSASSLLLSACGTLSVSVVTPPPVTPTLPAGVTVVAIKPAETGTTASPARDPLGEVYFFTLTPSSAGGRANLPFQMLRLPGSCVVGLAECPKPELVVPPFPMQQALQNISWSPDGSFAVLVHEDDVSRLYKLLFFDPLAGTWISKFESAYIDRSTSWSPDGNWIVFRSMNDQEMYELYAIQRDGSGLKMLASLSQLPDTGNSYVMDGWLAENIVVRPEYPDPETAGLVYLIGLADGNVQPMPEALTTKAHFTPSKDGAWLAYDEYNSETMEHKLFVARPDGTNPVEIASFLTDTSWLPIVWSPDNDRLAYVQADAGPGKGTTMHVYVINRDGTGLQEVCRPRDIAGGLMFSPDGKYLLANEMGGTGAIPGQLFVVNLETLEQHIFVAPSLPPDVGWANTSWQK